MVLDGAVVEAFKAIVEGRIIYCTVGRKPRPCLVLTSASLWSPGELELQRLRLELQSNTRGLVTQLFEALPFLPKMLRV